MAASKPVPSPLPRRQRSGAVGDTETDLQTEVRLRMEANRDKAEAELAVDDKMVTVVIEKDYTLILDNHREVRYKAGIDEMPLSHAKHWWSKNAGGVKLYVGRRKPAKEAEVVDTAPATPPAPDPEKLAALGDGRYKADLITQQPMTKS